MKLILVTGANKGIGLAIVKRLLAEYADTRLLLGSRDSGRGEEAVKEVLASLGPQYTSRLEMLQLDVTSEQSVAAAVEKVRSRYGGEQPLYGLVNNAGGSLATDRETIQLNTYAVIRVCEAFLPLIQQRGGLLFVILLSRFFKILLPLGRIVQISSASGPSYVSKLSQELQAIMVDGMVTFAEAETRIIKPYLKIKEDKTLSEEEQKAALTELGLADGAYGVSKASLNSYTMELARRHPDILINSCTPGWIATDLSKGYAEKQGKTPKEIGMKTPEEGAQAALYLTMTDLRTELPGYQSGRFYGSDAVRSPLHKYRSPGTPAYDGAFP